MTELEVREKAEILFLKVLSPLKINLEPNTSRVYLSYWDSITHLNLIFAIEKFFKIKILLGEIELIEDFNYLVRLILKKLELGAKD